MSAASQRGFGPVLANRSFRALWIAQALAQTAQQAIHFVQMVLVEELTGSSTHIGLVILSFTLPGVFFSSLAGVLVDRWPKRMVLVGSNAIRVLLVSGYLLVLGSFQGWWVLLGIYLLTFASSAVGQFFAPAEASTIPLLVGEEQLLTANSLFNLTLAISQVVGIIILGPLATKLIGTRGAFVAIALMYLGATMAVTRLPRITAPGRPRSGLSSLSRWERTRAEVTEGWTFVMRSRRVLLALSHLVLISTVIMIMAMLAPGFASRVLGKQPEDAVFVFAPAGVGMLLATTLVGRFGYRVRKDRVGSYGLFLTGLGFVGLGLITQGYRILPEPLLELYPQAALSLTTSVMGISFLLGVSMSAVSILGQTSLQEASPPDVRGRVFALQFMLNNLIGIPPMLTLGGLADWMGIPQVMLIIGVCVLIASVASIYFTLSPLRRDSLQRRLHSAPQALVLSCRGLMKRGLRRAADGLRRAAERLRRAAEGLRSAAERLRSAAERLRRPQEWIARTAAKVRQAGKRSGQAWHAVLGNILSLRSRLRLGPRAAPSNPNPADPVPADKSDHHAEEPARSASEQHPEDRGD